MMSWDEATNYCKDKDSELLMEETSPCKRGPGGGGEWLGLRRRWMLKSQRKKTGKETNLEHHSLKICFLFHSGLLRRFNSSMGC